MIKQITRLIQQFLDTSLVITTLHDNKHSIQIQFLIPKFHKTIEITNNGIVTIRCKNKTINENGDKRLNNTLLSRERKPFSNYS